MAKVKLQKENEFLNKQILQWQNKHEASINKWQTAMNTQKQRNKQQIEKIEGLLKDQSKVQGKQTSVQKSTSAKKPLHIQISNLMLLIYNNIKPDSVFNKQMFQQLSKIILQADKIILQLQKKINLHDSFQGSSSPLQPSHFSRSFQKVVHQNQSLKTTISQMIANNASFQQKLSQFHEQSLRKLNESNQQLTASLIKQQTVRIQLESTNEKIRDQLQSLKRTLASTQSQFESEILLLKSAQQHHAPIQAERQKLKSFYENELLRNILQSDSDVPKSTQLSCQIISLKLENTKLQNQVSQLTLSHSRANQARQQLQQLYNTTKEKLQSFEKKETVSNCEAKLQRVRKSLQLMGDDLQNKKCDSLDIIQNKVFQKMLNQQSHEILTLKNRLAIKPQIADSSNPPTERQQKILQKQSTQYKSELQDVLSQKQKIIQALEAKVIELRAQHLQQLQLFQSDQQLQLAEAKAQLDKDYQELNARFKPGEAPGEIKRTKELLQHRCRELEIELDRISNQNLLIVKKLESLQQQNQSLIDANQLQKQALGDIQMAVLNGNESNKIQEQSQIKKSAPQITGGLKKKQLRRQHSIDQASIKGKKANENNDKFKSPKLVIALIDAKLSEAQAVRRVRKAGRTQVQLRQIISKLNAEKQDLEGKIRLLERTVKSHQIAQSFAGAQTSINNQTTNIQQYIENTSILKKRILQLESQNQDLKLKQSQNLLNYQSQARLSEQLIPPQIDQQYHHLNSNSNQASNDLFNSLINGFILLLDELYKRQIQKGHHSNIPSGQGYSLMSSQINLQSSRQLGEPSEPEKNIMVMSQLSLAQVKQNDFASGCNPIIQHAQRVVIKSMIEKLRKLEQIVDPELVDQNQFKLPTAPSNQTDRQLWYLQLLEAQIQSTDREIKKLMQYTKKVQVDVSGNLVSAAQIKAAAFQLASQTNAAAGEVEQIRNLCKLVKNDVVGIKQNIGDTSQVQSKILPVSVMDCQLKPEKITRTINPFTYPENNPTSTPLPPQQLQPITFLTPQTALQTRFDSPQDMKKYIFELLNQNQSLKNRITLTDKVKATIENDLVQLKLKSAEENEGLKIKVQKIAKELQINKQQSNDLQLNTQSNLLMLQEKERRILFLQGQVEKLKTHLNEKTEELQELVKTKNVVAKQTTRLQNEMRSWKNNVQDKLNKKEIQVNDQKNKINSLNEQISTLQKRISLLKKDKKSLQDKLNSNEAESIQALNSQIQDLQTKLTNQIQSRRGQVEFWVKQRAQLREKLDTLQQENLNLKQQQQKCSNPNNLFHQNTSRTSGPGISTIRQMHHRKDRSRSQHKNQHHSDSDTSVVTKSVTAQKKQIKKGAKRQKIKRLEKDIAQKSEESIKLREQINRLLQQFQNRQAEYIQTQKQLESEASMREMIAQRLNLLQKRQLEEQKKEEDNKQISQELSSLKDCFNELKSERNKLAQQISHKNHEDQQNQQKTEQMIICMRDLNNERTKYKAQLDEINSKAKRISDDNINLKREITRIETQATQLREQNTKMRIELQHITLNSKRIQQQCNSFQNKYNESENKLIESRSELKSAILSQQQNLQKLRKQTMNLIEQSEKNAKLNQSHIELLRSRFVTEIERVTKNNSEVKRKSQATAENLIQVTQKEAVIKQLKQELKSVKSKLANKEQKESNIPQKDTGSKKRDIKKTGGINPDIILHPQFHKPSQAEIKAISEKGKLLREISSIQIQLDSYKSKVFNLLLYDITIDDLIAKNTQIEIGRDKISALQEHIAIIQNQKSQAAFKTKSLSKDINDINKQHKTENTRLREEIAYLKEKWVSPQHFKDVQGQKRELEAQLKSQKEELSRKKELLTCLKSQDEQTRTQTNALRNEIDQMKDDAEKIRRLTKQTFRKDSTLKEMRTMMQAVRTSERKLLQQNASLNDKIKNMRNDLARKDCIVKEMKDKMQNNQSELVQSKAMYENTDRKNDKIKKMKLQIDRKDNQILVLKNKIESLTTSVQKLEELNKSAVTNNIPSQNELDKQTRRHEQTRFKLRKAEGVVHSILVFVRRLLRERVNQVKKLRQRAFAQKRAIQLTKKNRTSKKGTELGQTMNRQYLKDGLDILQMSIDQLDDFVGSQLNSGGNHSKVSINSDNKDLDALLIEMDEIVEEGANSQFNGEDLFKAFEVLFDEKRQLQGQVSELSKSGYGGLKDSKQGKYMGKQNQAISSGRGKMVSSVGKYENYLQNLRKKEASELHMKQL